MKKGPVFLTHSVDIRSSMSESRLSSLVMLSVKWQVACKLDFSDVIDRFVTAKAQPMLL